MNSLKKIGITIMTVGAILSLYNLYKDFSIFNNYGFYILIVGLIVSMIPLFQKKTNKG